MTNRIIACLCAAMGLLGMISPCFAEDTVIVPDIEIYRRDIPESAALEFVQQLKIGFCLGNTFDAYDDSFNGDDLLMESRWVGIKTTDAMIGAVYDAGFRTLRLPVSWHNHVDDNFIINEAWLNRVQEVVDMAISRGMYVILNTHHDVQTKYYYPTSENYETSAKYISTIWTQLAERFGSYDEHLIFESMNEPRPADTDNEWYFDPNSEFCLDVMSCINKLNQVFVDTVRATGGINAERYLMIPSYDASYTCALSDYFILPADSADNKLIVSVHAYTPYSFVLQDGGTDTYSMVLNAPQAHENVVFMNALYDKYITKGIPVVIGEFGARNKNDNTQARVDFASQYVALASARCIPCIWWDNNAFKGNGELFGLLNRKTLEWVYPEIVEGMMKYAGYTTLPEYNK